MLTKEELLKAKQWINKTNDNMELIWLFEHIEEQEKEIIKLQEEKDRLLKERLDNIKIHLIKR